MDCGTCGATNRDVAQFCGKCGAPLARRCGGCGTELPPDLAFCDVCGRPVSEAAEAPDAAPRFATRKTVTVLFSDLTGSTALGERLDPESVRSLMAPVYAAMRSEVESRGGYVAKFVGDGVMALFGIPDVREDDAIRALDAAVGMRAAIDRLSADMPSPLSLKVGVNTGEVVTGAGDEDIVGDCINVASRLEGAAAPGEVLVGEETWRLTRSNATYDAVAPLTLKGKAQPVPAYRLVALERTQEAGSAPFVGRDSELQRLQQAFDDVAASKTSRLISIIGSPGLGKTRLTRELGVALSDRALVVETRCDAAGSATFAPVAEALRTAAGIGESAEPQAVVEAIAALVPEDEDKDRIAQRAAALLGAGAPGSTEETFWAIRRIIETAAGVQPMVLVIDDMHWAEPLMLDLVEHLAQWIRTAPVLLVITGRPELREVRPSLTERDSVIALEGLDGYATERLAQGLLGTDRVPRELLARLPESTEGNPLFVREFVRMLVDDGILRQSGGGWVATVNVDAIEVPPTIQSLLAARVDRLTAHERTVLELASVVGKEFYRGAIEHLAAATVRVGLDGHLESLRRKELVEPAGTYWIDEPVFRFHHALIQDAAYRRLLKESRAELHERVAEWLEQKTQGLLGENDELIGYHLEQAHESRRQLGPLDDHGRSLGERAARLLASAARRALDLDDLPAAAALAGRALDRLDVDHPDRAEILLVRCEALLATGDMAEARRAIGALERVADSARLAAWATCFTGELANMTDPGRLHETEKFVRAAATELSDLGDAAGAAKAHTVRATALAQLGRVAECEVALDDALSAAREASDRRRVTDVLGRAPLAALWGPSPVSRAGGRCLDIVRLLRITTGSPAVEATSLRCQAVLEAFRGRTDAARRMLRKARRDLEELGLSHGICETEMFSGIVELVAGDPPAAIEHLRAAHDGLLAMGVDVHAARAAALLARAHLALDEEDEADALADESERLGGEDLKTAIAWRAVRAEILARRGELDEARRLAESAVEIAGRTDALVDHGDACGALAAVCRASGDFEAARGALEQATALYERKGATALVGSGYEEAPDVVPSELPAAVTTNRAAELAEQAYKLLEQRAFDEFVALHHPDCAVQDRRMGLGSITHGHDELRPQAEVIMSVAEAIRYECLATRGETVALGRVTFHAHDPSNVFNVQVLQITELAEDGQIRSWDTFDADDVDTATSELDRRSAAGGGPNVSKPPANRCVRVFQQLVDALLRRDWANVAAVFTEDVVWADRRAGSQIEVVGRAANVRDLQVVLEIGTSRIDFELIATRGQNLALWRQVTGGERYEAEFLGMAEINREGLIVARIAYDLSALSEAMSELDRRFAAADAGAPAAAGPPKNRCTRVIEQGVAAVLRGDWDLAAALLAEDTVYVDARSGMRTEVFGRTANVENLRIITDIGVTRIDGTLIATRGENLALRREVFGADEGADFEAEVMVLAEMNEEGLIARRTVYDVSDLAAALVQLDDCFVAGEGAEFADVVSATAAIVRAYNQKDWTSYEYRLAKDIVHVDHRPVSLGEIRGSGSVVEAVRTLADLVPELRIWADSFPALRPDACVVRFASSGPSADGGSVEMSYIAVVHVEQGLITQLERFGWDEEDAAVARLRELATTSASADLDNEAMSAALVADRRYAAQGADQEAAVELDNAAMRLALRRPDLFKRRAWDEWAASVTEDVVIEDRRPIVGGNEAVGRDAAVDVVKAIADVGVVHADAAPVAIRGPSLALVRIRFRGADARPDANVAEVLQLLQVTDEGLLIRSVTFDADDLDAALTELDQRFLAELDETDRGVFIGARSLVQAVNAADWDWVREIVHADFTVVDHRPASLGELNLESYISAVTGLRQLIPDLYMYLVEPIAWTSEAGFSRLDGVGTTPDGTHIEMAFYFVGKIRDGKGIRSEWFPLDQRDAAEARFAELTAAREVSGSAARGEARAESLPVYEAFVRLYNARDWAAICALFTDDAVVVDRRPAALGEMDPDMFVRALSELVTLIPDRRARTVTVHIWGPDGGVVRSESSGTTSDGAFVEAAYEEVWVLRGGEVVRCEFYPGGEQEAALARFDELSRELSAAPGTIENRAVRVWRRFVAALERRDWDAIAEFCHPDVVLESRRRGLRDIQRGRDALIEAQRAILAVGTTRFVTTPLSVWRDHLAVGRLLTGGDAFEVEALLVMELDETGLVRAVVDFDPDDLEGALEEAQSRFFPTLDDDLRRHIEASTSLSRAINTKDWNAVRRSLAEDVVVVDHRPASLGEIRSVDDYIAAVRQLTELIPDLYMYGSVLHDYDSDVVLGQIAGTGTTPDGAPVELAFHAIGCVKGGLLVRQEWFAIDCLDDARVRFEELVHGQAGGADVLANACTRKGERWLAAFDRRDWDAVADAFAEQHKANDRRSGFPVEVFGRSAVMDNVRVIADQGAKRIATKTLATRGERLALTRRTVTGDPSSFEVVYLTLEEIDETGRIVATDMFDEDDIDAAFDELDRRAIQSPDASEAYRLGLLALRAMNRRDWKRFRELTADDWVYVDYQPAGVGSLDFEQWVASFSSLLELAPDYVQRAICLYVDSDRGGVARVHEQGIDVNGNVVDFDYATVFLIRDGRLSRFENFAIEQLDRALVRFEELCRDQPTIENKASRTLDRVLKHFEHREWDEIGELYSHDFQGDDRRLGFRTVVNGRQESVDGWRAAAEVGTTTASGTVLATRGERLALTRIHFAPDDPSPDAFSVDIVFLTELGPDGRIVFAALHDPGAQDPAYAEVDQRYLIGEGALFPFLRTAFEHVHAYNARDWDRMRATLTDDVIWTDHRPASYGTLEGPDAVTGIGRGMVDLIPDAQMRIAKDHKTTNNASVASVVVTGNTSDGVEVEIVNEVVTLFRDGRMSRIETFPELGAAMARFDELLRDQPTIAVPSLENAATRLAQSYGAAFDRQDWDAIGDMLSEDSVWDDRRRGLRSYFSGRDARVENVRAIASVGASRFEYTPIAVRGERLTLMKALTTGADADFSVEMLMITELDDAGRASRTVVFDPDDLDAAFAELDLRYASGEAAPYPWAGLAAELLEAHRARDWEKFGAGFSDDFVYVDYRQASVGDIEGRAEFVRAVRGLVDVAPDTRLRILALPVVGPDGAVLEAILTGTNTEEGVFELPSYLVTMVRDRSIWRQEEFPFDQREAALARFEELKGRGPRGAIPDLENECTRAFDRIFAAIARADWSATEALIFEDATMEDRRKGFAWRMMGRAEILENTKAANASGVPSRTPVATRGARLALSTYKYRLRNDYEVEFLEVDEIDDDGKASGCVMFDAGAIDAALAELDQRYLVAEGSEYECWSVVVRAVAAFNRRDWDEWTACAASGFVYTDHRPANMGRVVGTDAVLMDRALVDVIPDLRLRISTIENISNDICLVRGDSQGTNSAGGPIEISSLAVIHVRDGRVVSMDEFPLTERDAARARFEEISAASSSSLENACARVMREWAARFERRDWVGLLEINSEDATAEDRRAGLQSSSQGRQAVIDNLRAMADVGAARAVCTPLATRGEHLMLAKWTFVGGERESAFEVEVLIVNESDEKRRHRAGVIFDVDDLDGASVELDDRYVRGEGAPYEGTVLAMGSRLCRMINSRDWDAFRTVLDDDLVFVDHRPASLGQARGGDRRVEELRTLLELMSHYRLYVARYHALANGIGLGELVINGTTSEGSEVEISYHMLVQQRDGLIARMEAWDLGDLDRALARFEELRVSSSSS